LIDRYGNLGAIIVAILPAACAAWTVIAYAAGLAWLLFALILAPLIYVLARSYVELVRLMVDMLIPK
jgi:hypothetical protein